MFNAVQCRPEQIQRQNAATSTILAIKPKENDEHRKQNEKQEQTRSEQAQNDVSQITRLSQLLRVIVATCRRPSGFHLEAKHTS